MLQQDHDEAFASLNATARNAYIFLAVILLITIILSVFLSRGLSNPINALAKSAVMISKGGLKEEILGVTRTDEIGQLARSMDRMKRSLSISLERLKGG